MQCAKCVQCGKQKTIDLRQRRIFHTTYIRGQKDDLPGTEPERAEIQATFAREAFCDVRMMVDGHSISYRLGGFTCPLMRKQCPR
ncbi:hypothetical protein D3C87_1972080 [compost metagenome]